MMDFEEQIYNASHPNDENMYDSEEGERIKQVFVFWIVEFRLHEIFLLYRLTFSLFYYDLCLIYTFISSRCVFFIIYFLGSF